MSWKVNARSTIFLAAAAAILYQLYLAKIQPRNTRITFRGGRDYPTAPTVVPLSQDELDAFRRDGFLLKKKVIVGEELKELLEAGESHYKSRSITDWLFRSAFAKLSTQIWRQNSAFAQLAFESPVVSISAQLFQAKMKENANANEDAPTSAPPQPALRILKDGFFGFQGGNKNAGCSFHCDDKFFWPASDDTTGVNVWLTLSPLTAREGGGIRVVNQSRIEPQVFDECLAVIRGGTTGTSYNNTCQMETLSPACFDKMMQASTVHDMEPGDALFWDRWTFHRSEPFHRDSASKDGGGGVYKLRYTVRYVPDTAVAEGVVHPSIEPGARLRGPYYPQVWPQALPDEVDAIRGGTLEADSTILSPSLMWRILKRMLVQYL